MGPAQRARLRQFFEEYRESGQYEVLLRSYPPNPGYFGRTAEFEAASAYIARQSSCVELLSPEELRRYEEACRTADALDRELQARQEESLTVPPNEIYFELEIQEVLELGLHAVEWTCGIVSFIPYDDIRDVIRHGDSDFQMPHLLLDPGDLVLKAVGHMVGSEIVFTFGETEADRGGTLAQFLTLPPDEIERILQADPSLRCIDNDKAHELRGDWKYHRVVRDGSEWRVRSEFGRVVVWVPDEEPPAAERVASLDAGSHLTLSDEGPRLLVSLIEAASIAGGSPFGTSSRILRLSAAISAAQEPVVEDCIESLQAAGIIRVLGRAGSDMEISVPSEKVVLPELEVEQLIESLDMRVRRILLFHAYEELRVSRGARVTALTSLADDLGVPEELITMNVEALCYEGLLKLPFADAGTCQAEITVDGLRLCEHTEDLFDQLCCYSLPDVEAGPTPTLATGDSKGAEWAATSVSVQRLEFRIVDRSGTSDVRLTRAEHDQLAANTDHYDLFVDGLRNRVRCRGADGFGEGAITTEGVRALETLVSTGLKYRPSELLTSQSKAAAQKKLQRLIGTLSPRVGSRWLAFVCVRGEFGEESCYMFDPPEDFNFLLVMPLDDSA